MHLFLIKVFEHKKDMDCLKHFINFIVTLLLINEVSTSNLSFYSKFLLIVIINLDEMSNQNQLNILETIY